MIRRPPRSTLDRSSAASDVYKRQLHSLSVQFCLKKLPGTVQTSDSIRNKSHLGSNSCLLRTLKWSEFDHRGRLVNTVLRKSCREDEEKRAFTTGEDMPQKNNSGHASPFMAYFHGAPALPLPNFSSRSVTPSLSCQLSMSLSEQVCFKKLEKMTEAAGKMNFEIHAIAPTPPTFLNPASSPDFVNLRRS